MNDMLREIEEDIRQERAARLWHSFGKLMVGASIIVVLITVGIVVWQDHKQAYATEQTSQFMKGLDRLNVEDYKGAVDAFSALTVDENSPYYGLAMLRKAQAQNLLGDKAAAQKTYEALAKQNNSSDIFAGLGSILAASQANTPVEPVKGGTFYYSQEEWKGWQLLEQGKKDDAATAFGTLYSDPQTPPSIRNRAASALEQIAPEKLASSAPALGNPHE